MHAAREEEVQVNVNTAAGRGRTAAEEDRISVADSVHTSPPPNVGSYPQLNPFTPDVVLFLIFL